MRRAEQSTNDIVALDICRGIGTVNSSSGMPDQSAHLSKSRDRITYEVGFIRCRSHASGNSAYGITSVNIICRINISKFVDDIPCDPTYIIHAADITALMIRSVYRTFRIASKATYIG